MRTKLFFRHAGSHDQAAVEGCTFVDNQAGYDGGAIVTNPDAGVVDVTDSSFECNRALHEGGAIQAGGWSPFALNITRSLFHDNRGGAVELGDWAPMEVTLDANTFVANEHFALEWYSWETGSLLATDNRTLNHAGSGWVFHAAGDPTPGTAVIRGGVFYNNSVGLSMSDWSAEIEDVDFGVGADANTIDVTRCANLDGVSSFFYDPDNSVFCQ